MADGILKNLKNAFRKDKKPVKRTRDQIRKQRENVASFFSGKESGKKKKFADALARRKRRKKDDSLLGKFKKIF